MAATDPQRQLLTLIREFASEKSQGERRMIGLKKRIQELGCEVDVANAEMEEVKCIKETTEQELKDNELQLALNEASIQTLEARISIIQDEISSVGSQVEGLKMFSSWKMNCSKSFDLSTYSEVFSDGGNSERNKSIAGLNKISLQTLQCVELAVWS
ncbi:coiled-coil domain-containing protein [Salix suchowensis]|nr:coiled-coil domain-containing protein [Salix suchowensis]